MSRIVKANKNHMTELQEGSFVCQVSAGKEDGSILGGVQGVCGGSSSCNPQNHIYVPGGEWMLTSSRPS
jgi:hypothetical protein